MKRKMFKSAILSILLVATLSLSVCGNGYNLYYSQASPISAETPKVILQQGNIGASTIYTNATSATVSVNATTGWSYRKSHMINGSTAGALTNYQMKIVVHKTNGTDSGQDVYVDTKVRDDFGDVRFTSSDGTTLLDYWMENYTLGDSAIFWVKIPSIPANPDITTIYVYYGNSNATTTSNGANTFECFDDFSENNLDRWEQGYYPNYDVAVDSSFGNPSPSMKFVDVAKTTQALYKNFNIKDAVIEYDVYLGGAARTIQNMVFRFDKASGNGYMFRLQTSYGDGGWFKLSGGSWSKIGSNYPDVAQNQWHHLKLVISGTTFKAYVDHSENPDIVTDTSYQSEGQVGSQNDGGAEEDNWIDNFKVRKYVDPEPTHGSWGSEEVSHYFLGEEKETVPCIASGWFYQGFRYRKKHSIMGSPAGNQTDYQMSITIVNGPGTDSVATMYTTHVAQPDFDDVRFTWYNATSDREEPCSYWRETLDAGANATFWIKIPFISNSTTNTIYVYYGNSTVATTSNGTNTFTFFDDFSGGLSKWTKHVEYGNITINPNYGNPAPCLEIGGGTTSGNYGFSAIGSDATYSEFQDGIIEADIYPATNALPEIIFRGNYSANSGYKGRWDCRSGSESPWMKPPYSGWSAFGEAVTRFGVAGQWQKAKLAIKGSTFEIYSNDELKSAITDTQYSGPGEIGLANHYGAYSRFDNVRVRKHVDPEPTHGCWGNEEKFEYVLKIVDNATYNWKIRLRAYDQSDISRLYNCTVYFYNGDGVSRQIYIYNGTYSQQFGNWYNLTSLSTVYIAMRASTTNTGASYVYVYLEILVPDTSTYNLFIITFEIT